MLLQSPLRPNLQKGALAVYPTHTPGSQPSHVILFQFNPDTMKRTLAHRAAAGADRRGRRAPRRKTCCAWPGRRSRRSP